MKEVMNAKDHCGAQLVANGAVAEQMEARGKFTAKCYDKHGKLKWVDEFPNTVMTLGKNAMLDNSLSGAAYTVTGPYMGLISSVGYSAILAADTMASHAGWTEAGNANAPAYSGNRKTAVFSAAAAGAKAVSPVLAFTFTSGGTVKGGFICFQAGALNTIDNAAGTLFSAGLFTGGDRVVQIGDVLNISYSCSL